MNDRLCLFPYYGGKAKLSCEIAGIVESYKKARTYIEPFGGAASVLLNKAPHEYEIYNEQSPGMCILFEMLSDSEMGYELIDYIYKNTTYSLECFEESRRYRDLCEDNYWDYLRDGMNRLAHTISKTTSDVDFKKLGNINRNPGTTNFTYADVFRKNGKVIKGLTKRQIDDINYFNDNLIDLKYAYHKNKFTGYFDSAINVNEPYHKDRLFEQLEEIRKKIIRLSGKTEQDVLNDEDYKKFEKNIRDRWEKSGRFRGFAENTRQNIFWNDIKLAASTYVVYKQSRDGMGKTFRGYDYDNDFNYRKEILKLYDIMERLQGIQVWNSSAEVFFDERLNEVIHDPEVVIYADPSYLKQGNGNSKKNVHDKITIKEAIEQLKKKEYNPGRVYKASWTRDEHESFLQKIQKAKCKFVVSNYRDEENLYDSYLNAENGWNYIEYETTTTVSTIAADRTEVVWYNF